MHAQNLNQLSTIQQKEKAAATYEQQQRCQHQMFTIKWNLLTDEDKKTPIPHASSLLQDAAWKQSVYYAVMFTGEKILFEDLFTVLVACMHLACKQISCYKYQ